VFFFFLLLIYLGHNKAIKAIVGKRMKRKWTLIVEFLIVNIDKCFYSGKSYNGDAAIDDLRIFENPCVLTPTNAQPIIAESTTTTTTEAITTVPLGPYDCTFETGICTGWNNMANNRFNWTRVQALTVPAPRMFL
jgi:hypothetical protein